MIDLRNLILVMSISNVSKKSKPWGESDIDGKSWTCKCSGLRDPSVSCCPEQLYFGSVAQSHQTLGNLVDCSPPGSSVHGVLQVRILEWVAISYSRGSSQTRDQPMSPALADRFFTTMPPGKPMLSNNTEQMMTREKQCAEKPCWGKLTFYKYWNHLLRVTDASLRV